MTKASTPCCAPVAAIAVLLLSGQPVAAVTYIVDQRHTQASDQNAGTAEAPFKTIGKAAGVVAAGDAVTIRTGVYREAVVIERSGTPDNPIRFQPDVAANVVVTGADVLRDLAREPGADAVFSAPWPHLFLGWTSNRAHPDDGFHRVIGRAEQVFVQGYPLRQVLTRVQLGRGSFFVDEGAQRLYVCSADAGDLTKLRVEASVREVKGEYVHTRPPIPLRRQQGAVAGGPAAGPRRCAGGLCLRADELHWCLLRRRGSRRPPLRLPGQRADGLLCLCGPPRRMRRLPR